MSWTRHLPWIVLATLALWSPALVQLVAGNLDVATAALRLAGAALALALAVEGVGRLVEGYAGSRDNPPSAPPSAPRRRRDDRVVDGEIDLGRSPSE